MAIYPAGDLESPQAGHADSDWVDAQFAAIIAANWPGWPSRRTQRVAVALAVRADREVAGGRQRLLDYRVGRARPRPVNRRRWPRERSPPRIPAGQR